MAPQNSEMLDSEKGVFSVLGLVPLRLGGPYIWHCEDINEDAAVGSTFRAYETDESTSDGIDVASVTVVDVTDDPTEPDVSMLGEEDIPSLDAKLQEAFANQLQMDGMHLVKWMSSQLNSSDGRKALVTPYIVRDGSKERQYIALRTTAGGRKVVVVGIFDTAKADSLAAPMFSCMRNMGVLG